MTFRKAVIPTIAMQVRLSVEVYSLLEKLADKNMRTKKAQIEMSICNDATREGVVAFEPLHKKG